MDEASPLEKGKSSIIEATFSQSKTEKNVKFDFYIIYYKPITNN